MRTEEEDGEKESEQDRRSHDFRLIFAYKGNKFGISNINGVKIQIWHLKISVQSITSITTKRWPINCRIENLHFNVIWRIVNNQI